MSERSTENVRNDARFRADAELPTGKTLHYTSDWQPSHWEDYPAVFIEGVRNKVDEIADTYGFDGIRFRVFREIRHTEHVTETTRSEKFQSEHFSKNPRVS